MSESSRIVITGVAGFIGSLLSRELCDAGYEVVGIDNFICGYEKNLSWIKPIHNFTFHRLDVGDAVVHSLVRKNDILIHLADISALATCQENPQVAYTNNVANTAGLLELSRVKGVAHFIFASTSAVYEHAKTFPIVEDTEKPLPDLIYSLGKHHCEDLVHANFQVYGQPFTIMRFFNVYGSGADDERTFPPLIPYVIREMRAGRSSLLHSDGSQRRDYIFVTDLTSFIHKLLKKGPLNTTVNLCSGQTYSVREIVDIVKSTLGSTVEPTYRDPQLLWEKAAKLWEGERSFPASRMKEEVEKCCIWDAGRALELLDWKATVTMEEGIRRMTSN